MNPITVKQLVKGTLVREGAGVKLHRYIGMEPGNPYEPMLLFDYFDSTDVFDYMAGFPPHPHRGFETVTYLLHGSITHEDNQGRIGTINAGDVQWMTAGKGIIHSEMPSTASGRLQGLQLWLNLPAAEKMRPPRYQEKRDDEFPREKNSCGQVIKVIAGTTDKGTTSPISDIATHPLFLDISLPAGDTLQQHIPSGYQAILFVLSGTVIIGEEQVKTGILANLNTGDVLQLTCNVPSHCLLIAARKLHEPIVRHGPFVMNTQEEILQALDDLRNHRF